MATNEAECEALMASSALRLLQDREGKILDIDCPEVLYQALKFFTGGNVDPNPMLGADILPSQDFFELLLNRVRTAEDREADRAKMFRSSK